MTATTTTENTYRDWTINWCEMTMSYVATGPNYDADWLGEEMGWQDNGHRVYANDIIGIRQEVDDFLAEEEERRPCASIS